MKEKTLTSITKLFFVLEEYKKREEIFGVIEKNPDLITLFKVISALKEQLGVDKVLEVTESNPSLLLGWLNTNVENLNLFKIVGKKEIKEEGSWTDNNVKDFMKKLKITKMQATLIDIMENKNKGKGVTLSEIELEFKERGVEIHTGSMIGGSLAGLTKKCEAYNIPPIFKSYRDNDIYKYTLTASAKGRLIKYLEL